jgi:hypothetical protein
MTGKPFAQHGTFREMSDILVTTILRDSWSVVFSSMAHRKGTVRRKENCARGTLPLNSTTATGTPSCVPPGLKSLVPLQFSSNYDSEESNAREQSEGLARSERSHYVLGKCISF